MTTGDDIGTILGDGFLAIHQEMLASPETEQQSLRNWLEWLNLEGYQGDQFCSSLRSTCEQILGPAGFEALIKVVQSMAEAPYGIENLMAHLEQDYPALLSTLTKIEVTRQEELQNLSTKAGGINSKQQKIGRDIGITYITAGLTVAVGAGIHDYLRRRKIEALESLEREKNRLADGTIKGDEDFAKDMVRDARRRGWSVDEIEKIRNFEPKDLLKLAKDRDYAAKVENRFKDLIENPELLRDNRIEIFKGLEREYRSPETRKLMTKEEKDFIEKFVYGKDEQYIPKEHEYMAKSLERDDWHWNDLVGKTNLKRSTWQGLQDKWNGKTNGDLDFQRYADQKIKSEMLNDEIKKDHLATIDDMDAYLKDLEYDSEYKVDLVWDKEERYFRNRLPGEINEETMDRYTTKEIRQLNLKTGEYEITRDITKIDSKEWKEREEKRLKNMADDELDSMEEKLETDFTLEESKLTNDAMDTLEDL